MMISLKFIVIRRNFWLILISNIINYYGKDYGVSQTSRNNEATFSLTEQLVSTIDTQGEITYANNEICEVAGHSIGALIG